MIINIFGSTGEIGKKTLNIIQKEFPRVSVNLLCANANIELILKQITKYKPKYVYLNDKKASLKLQEKVNKKTIILSFHELLKYLRNSSSDLSILAISGYKSLHYLEPIINNTKNLGIVSKEAIVSAGHLFKKKNYFLKTKIFPLDSEHFSLFDSYNSIENFKIDFKSNKIKKIILTASGGPFYKKKFANLRNISFKEAICHPKWKMGYKNSIDSATLVNKCLEVIEAHYLFDIPYNKIDIVIHPEALVHSIIEKNNYTTKFNLFKNDMSIPIINFLMLSKYSQVKYVPNLYLNSYSNLSFFDVLNENFPIYKYFINLDKSKPANLIKFNVGNEYAVNMFRDNLIKYTDIYKIIKKVCSLNLYYPLKNIKEVINYHEEIESKIKNIF